MAIYLLHVFEAIIEKENDNGNYDSKYTDTPNCI